MLNSKRFAVLCAIVHYGMGNLARDSKPPNIDTLLKTATRIESYIKGEDTPT